MSQMIEGEFAYNFKLKSCERGEIALNEIDANYIVLYFYPKDDTPGCTLEAKEFSQLKPEFQQLGAEVFGISKNDIATHIKFINKYDLQIDLFFDDAEIAENYGVWVEKSMYGKKYMGIERTTFLLDKTHKILKIWKKVKPEGHASEVFNYIKSHKN